MLHHGDCISVMNQHIEPQSVDMILVDPPYGTTACKWDSVIPLAEMWAAIKRVAKKDAALVFFCAQPFSSALISSNVRQFKEHLVYSKPSPTGFMNANSRHMKYHEDIAVFCAGRLSYFPQRTINGGRPYRTRRSRPTLVYNKIKDNTESVNTDGSRFPGSILKFKPERGLHLTQKPVPLLEYLIKTYSKEGDTVLDFTMGSGSTGVACVNTSRKFIGIERDSAYFATASARIAAALAVLE